MLSRRLLVLPVLVAAAVAAGCGGGGGGSGSTTSLTPDIQVPPTAVAVVAGTVIPKTEFDALFSQYQAAYKAQNRDFPKAGTSQYEGLKTQTINYLVQRVEFAKEAAARGIKVTPTEIDQKLTDLKQQFYGGDQQKYEAELKKYGTSEAAVKQTIEAQLIAQKLYDEITKDVTVSETEITDYYNAHKDQFTTPEQRHVAHILVKTKKEAENIYNQLKKGGQFAALAKKYSTDPGSAKNGGDLGTAPRTQWVKPFGDALWTLKTGEISEPVESQFGWHIIKALGDIEPAKTQALSELHDTIKQQLEQSKKDKKMQDWVDSLQAKYSTKIGYAVGFTPSAAPTTTGAAGDTTTGG
jgi:foldase protein PrsA